MSKKIVLTAQNMIDKDIKPQTAKEKIRSTLLERLENENENGDGTKLFKKTVFPEETIHEFIDVLLAGKNPLFYGPPGTGKTTAVRELFYGLYPREVWTVAGCPIGDDPYSLVDKDYSARMPPCPVCVLKYSGLDLEELGSFTPGLVEPKKVEVVNTKARPGRGFKVIKGSPEAFADKLIGRIDFVKYQEIGKASDPRVFDKGDMLMAHRGILFIDDVYKLPKQSQNALLGGVEEREVWPSGTETPFPLDAVIIGASNTEDMTNAILPLVDRFTGINFPWNKDLNANYEILMRNLADNQNLRDSRNVFIPRYVRDSVISLFVECRESSSLPEESLSNRAMIESVEFSLSDAVRENHTVQDNPKVYVVTPDNVKVGIQLAMGGKVKGRSVGKVKENKETVRNYIETNLDGILLESARLYWCGFQTLALGNNREIAKSVIKRLDNDELDPQFARYVAEKENIKDYTESERTPVIVKTVYEQLKSFGVFKEPCSKPD